MAVRLIHNASIGTKVAIAPATAILCLALVGAVGLIANHRLERALTEFSDRSLPRMAVANQLGRELESLQVKVFQSLAWEGASFSADKIAALDKQILQDLLTFKNSVLLASQATDLQPRERERLQAVLAEYEKYQKSVQFALDIKTGMLGNASSFMTTLDGSFRTMKSALNALADATKVDMESSIHASQGLLQQNQLAFAAGLLVALLATASLSLLVARAIVRPLQDAARLARTLAGGELGVRHDGVVSKDATGQVLRGLDEVSCQFNKVITEVRQVADHVSLASAEIAAGSSDLSNRTENTAAALEQTSGLMAQLMSSVSRNGDKAVESDVMARNATEAAGRCGSEVRDVVQSIEAINDQAKRIGDIVGVIDAIAFQINVLALNASVEAARAGELGKGFNVVAGEVRSLALRSADAAREIRGLVSASAAQIDEGANKARAAGGSMNKVVESIRQLSGAVSVIAEATSGQRSGMEQAIQAVSEVDRATQQNAATAEQTMAATAALKYEAEGLVNLLATFRTSAGFEEPGDPAPRSDISADITDS